MDQMNPGMQPPMGAEAEAPATPVKTICINVMADGTFTVNEEAPEAEEAAPMMGQEPAEPPEAAEPAGQPAASIDEALNLARQLLQNDGRSAEEQMMAGYAKGKPAMAKPSPAQVFGE